MAAHAAGALSHPNIVTIHDTGTAAGCDRCHAPLRALLPGDKIELPGLELWVDAEEEEVPETSSTARQSSPRPASASTRRESPPPTSSTHDSAVMPAASSSCSEISGSASNQLTSRSDLVV